MYQDAVDKNEVVKTMVAEINWEFESLQIMRGKITSSVKKIVDGVKLLKKPAPPPKKKEAKKE